MIKGDLDSVRPDVRAFYASRGVPMVDLSHDQDTTDLTKCLLYLEARIEAAEAAAAEAARREQQQTAAAATAPAAEAAAAAPETPEQRARRLRGRHAVVVLGALGGRLDHIIAHLNNLYAFPHLDITLCGDGNLVRLLPRGRVAVRPHARLEGPTCGLVPLAAPAVATTRGLEWDLDATEMRFRGLISTSNVLAAPEVSVESDEELVWITEFAEDSRGGHAFSWGAANGRGGDGGGNGAGNGGGNGGNAAGGGAGQ